MENCNSYNQYYTDIFSEGKLVTTKCFDGKIYPEGKTFNVNNYKSYDNIGYYSWIDTNFKDYAFPDEDYNLDEIDTVFAKNCESKVYSLKQQQKFAGRIFNTSTDINGMLIYHGLGSGKTQTSIVIGEAFKFSKTNGDIIKGRTDSRVYIVVPAALQKQYYAEIIGKYESGAIKSAAGEVWISGDRQYYSSKVVRSTLVKNFNDISNLREQKLKLERSGGNSDAINDIQTQINIIATRNKDLTIDENIRVTKVYEILSHETFLNRLFKIEDNIYEPQGYLKVNDIYGKPTPNGIFKPNALLIIDEIQNLISATGTNYRRLLYALTFYASPTFKTVLLTGTPIYDKPYEFGLLINLLRPRVVFPDGRDDFNNIFLKDGTFTNQEYFKKMCSGYVSYFKGGNPIAYPYKKTTVMLHSMNEYQYSQYKTALIKEVKKDQQNFLTDQEFFINKQIDKVSSGIYNNSNQLCNISYPETTVTKAGKSVLEQNKAEFIKILNSETKKNISLDLNEQTDKILKLIQNYSSKFSKVAEMILNCPGSVFVFSNYVYYGVDAMGIIMDNIGYAAYPSRGPRGSYFIWKGEANSKYPDIVRIANKIFNDPRNIDGSLLKVMFGTQTVMEGVDFKNVNQIHILDPWWNDSRMQQIMARGIRFCSHKDFPPEKRIVDVFIHLSALGSFENVFSLEILENGYKRKIKSFMQIENTSNPDKSQWYIFESYTTKPDKEGNVELKNSSKRFLVSQIVEESVKRGTDQSLTKELGGWKGLDYRSVQEYMYSRSLEKLNVNRQFEKVIKEVAIDCTINKNGNVIRLEEIYLPLSDKTWKLFYENYSTGERYIRLNVKSAFKELPDNVFVLEDILESTAKKSNKFEFERDGKVIKLNKSLIIYENIDCKVESYTFKFPKEIVNLTINKELIQFLFKMKDKEIYEFLLNVINSQSFRNNNIIDPTLHTRLRKFLSKRNKERQMYIDSLKEFGWSGSDELWEQYTTEQLKIEYKAIN